MGGALLAAVAAPLIKDLASKGLAILSGAVLAKGKKVVEEKLGVDIESALTSEEGIYNLKKLEIENEQWLIDASIRAAEQQLEQEKEYLKDRQSAREMNQVAIQSDDVFVRRYVYFLATAIVLLGLGFMFIAPFYVPEENRDVLMIVLGAIMGLVTMVGNFFFGSSKGSKDKDAALLGGVNGKTL